MNNQDRHFHVKHVLDGLRAAFGDSNFGYRIQALFAHALLRLSAVIQEINQQGHPDIQVELDGQSLLLQVKSVSHASAPCPLMVHEDDLVGIRPSSDRQTGYFAILDCAAPPAWIMVEYHEMTRYRTQPVNIETLRACANRNFSRECTDEFTDMVLANKDKLHLLNYRTLCRRALRGDVL